MLATGFSSALGQEQLRLLLSSGAFVKNNVGLGPYFTTSTQGQADLGEYVLKQVWWQKRDPRAIDIARRKVNRQAAQIFEWHHTQSLNSWESVMGHHEFLGPME